MILLLILILLVALVVFGRERVAGGIREIAIWLLLIFGALWLSVALDIKFGSALMLGWFVSLAGLGVIALLERRDDSARWRRMMADKAGARSDADRQLDALKGDGR